MKNDLPSQQAQKIVLAVFVLRTALPIYTVIKRKEEKKEKKDLFSRYKIQFIEGPTGESYILIFEIDSSNSRTASG